jgi:hypothetical protein
MVTMFWKACCAGAMMIVSGALVHAAEPGAAPIPSAVNALKGCWRGTGEAVGKQVSITLNAKPIVDGAMFVVDTASSAVADPKDRYSAHLVFGGDNHVKTAAEQIVGYWADSFGGSATAIGRGESREGGFDITYQYPNYTFINRWRVTDDRLTWQIASRHQNGAWDPFASYSLSKIPCTKN